MTRRPVPVLIGLLLLLVAAVPTRAQGADTVPFTVGLNTPETFAAVIDGRLAKARELQNALLSVKGRRTVDNTLTPYDDMWGELYTAGTQAGIVTANHPDERMRKTGEELNRRVSAAIAEIPLRPDIYAALKEIDLTGADASTRYFVERELKDFRLAGVDKPEAARQHIAKLRDELTQVMEAFNRNLRAAKGQVVVQNPADLEGLPADFIARHKADAAGAVTLTTDNADARPVLTYAKNADLRRRMLLATYTLAPENLAVVDRMLRVRYELANALGFPTWAVVDAASRSVGTADAASQFIDRVVDASGAGAARDYAALVNRKQQDQPGSRFEIWDRTYYSELVRKASFDFDSRLLRPYFPFNQVLQGVLDISARIFGLTYTPAAGVDVWHPSVRVYEVRDKGALLGRVYLDLHPRPNKADTRGNVSTVRYGQAGRSIPEAVLASTLPGGEPGDPGLMTHDEVVALFHEVGHVVHRLIGGHQRWQRLSSLTLERDFTEAPSQMLEEWMWDPKTLATFAKHYQTGETIPAALLQQMRRASQFGQALEVRGQMVLARVALDYHNRDPRSFDPTTLWKEINDRYMPLQFPEKGHRQATFQHLGNPGYISAYYSYMWSLVIAKDMFSTFDNANLIGPGIATRFRETVFEPGSSKPAAELARDFLGRPFTSAAWERWLNGG
jgi:thimet oligopeptidase